MIKLTHLTFAPIIWVALGAAAYSAIHVKAAAAPALVANGLGVAVPLRAEQGAFAGAAGVRLQSLERRSMGARRKLKGATQATDRAATERALDAFDADARGARLAIADATDARDVKSFLGKKHRALGKLRLLEGAMDAVEKID